MKGEAAQWCPLFPDVEINFILDAVLRCGKMLKKRHATELEPQVNMRLCAYLRRDSKLRERPVEVHPEITLLDESGRVVGRCDIWFIYSTGTNKPWPYFVVEAKRLHVTFRSGWKSLIAGYVTGDQGMKCFTKERYAKGLRSGGMLGYVFDGKVDAARDGVAAAIKRAAAALNCAPTFDVISQSGSVVGRTSHGVRRGKFIIYHLFIAI